MKRIVSGTAIVLLLGSILLFAPLTLWAGASSGSSGSNLLVNGDFETGTLGGWSVGGVCSVSSSVVHSGSYSAYVSDAVYDSWISQELNLPANDSYNFKGWFYPLHVGNLGDVQYPSASIYFWYLNKLTMQPVFTVSYSWSWNDYTGNSSTGMQILVPFTESNWNLLDRNLTQDIRSSQLASYDLSQLVIANVTADYHYSTASPGAFYVDDLNLSILVPTPTSSASLAVYGYTDEPNYGPGDAGTLHFWVYNNGNESLILENVTIYYPWYSPIGLWEGSETITPSASTVIAAGGNWSSTSSFTVPNDGRISAGSNSIVVNVLTDKINATSQLTMNLTTTPLYFTLQDMNQLLTELTILAAAIVVSALIVAGTVLLSIRRLGTPQKP